MHVNPSGIMEKNYLYALLEAASGKISATELLRYHLDICSNNDTGVLHLWAPSLRESPDTAFQARDRNGRD